uniref:Tyrosine-protein kinase Fer-like n=1 Tax=Poecilia reticulata TaxID=8081 RepID=A0A3P9PT04_POERE
MGFGRDLINSHEGLLKLQDWELKLLETVKRFMTLRVKSDKEYAALLLSMTQQTEKQEAADYVSTVSKRKRPREETGGWIHPGPGGESHITSRSA